MRVMSQVPSSISLSLFLSIFPSLSLSLFPSFFLFLSFSLLFPLFLFSLFLSFSLSLFPFPSPSPSLSFPFPSLFLSFPFLFLILFVTSFPLAFPRQTYHLSDDRSPVDNDIDDAKTASSHSLDRHGRRVVSLIRAVR